MALAATLSAGVFADLLKVKEWTFQQRVEQQRTQLSGGEIHYADRAPAMWHGTARTIPLSFSQSARIIALINSRAGGLKTVMLYDMRLEFPPLDPDGSLLGSAVPKLGTITDRLHAAFTGFPSGYQIAAGTYFGILFDTSRYYLGQFVEDKTANSSGAVTATEIWPPLPASVAGTPNVSMIKPSAKFKITPNSAFQSLVSGMFEEISFSFEQTYSR